MAEVRISLDGRGFPLSLVIFDMDGTLTESTLDFARIRSEAGVPDGIPILEYIDEATPERAEEVRAVLMKHEVRDARSCRLNPEALDVLERLRAEGLTLAILTRNSRRCSGMVIERFNLPVDVLFAREDAPPKPAAESVLAVCEHCNIPPERTLVVGDYVFDVQAGKNAGAFAALLETAKTSGMPHPADFTLKRLSELLDILEFA